jgi:hypothetical protein
LPGVERVLLFLYFVLRSMPSAKSGISWRSR